MLAQILPPRIAQVVIDVSVCALSVVLAYLIRFEGAIPEQELKQMVLIGPYLVLAHLMINYVFGLYRIVWRYIGLREALRFLRAVAVVSGVLLAFRLFFPTNTHYFKVPIGIIVLEGVFAFAGLAGARFVRRIMYERRRRDAHSQGSNGSVPTLFVGAGEAGLVMAKEAAAHPDLGIRLLGFLDDDRTKTGMEIHGSRVHGTIKDLPDLVARTQPRQVIITTNAIPAKAILEIMDFCRPNVEVRTVPSLFHLLGSNVSLSMIREVRIEDLLSREPVPPSMSMEDLRSVYQGKRVLVTGAGGSIGSELCRQLALLKPSKILLVERDENNLFVIEREMQGMTREGTSIPCLIDVSDESEIERVFREHRPEVVCHAAAYKHVPMMERFPASAVLNNVRGTRNLVALSDRYAVEMFVMISTDKAVHPTSVMGATKRIAELLVQRAAAQSSSRFSCVRFGNVLGSRGSVVGIFQEQIQRGGPITVTHAEATRYFMTVQEAVNLVLQAATLGDRGEVFLLDMGEPVKIVDMARQMIRLSGFTEEDIPIEVVGLRPGEKLFEELNTQAEGIAPTPLRKIFQCAPAAMPAHQLERVVDRLQTLATRHDCDEIRATIAALGIGYAAPAKPERRPVPPGAEPRLARAVSAP